MSLASVTAKIRGVALHLGRADTGASYCGRRQPRGVDDSLQSILFTWKPEEVTCKQCLKRYALVKSEEEG